MSGNTRTVDISRNILRVLDVFKAPQVEGPLRLFNQQDVLFPQFTPILEVHGRNEDGSEALALRSSDGTTWAHESVGPFTNKAALGFGSAAFSGSTAGEIYRSVDPKRREWENLGVATLGGGNVYDLEGNRATGRIFLASFTDLVSGLYYSDDLGETWHIPAVMPSNDPMSGVDFFDGTWIATGEDRRVWRSTDDGNTWVAADTSAATTTFRAAHNVSKNLLSGRMMLNGRFPRGGGSVFSDDDGKTWFPGPVISAPNKTRYNSVWAPIRCPYGVWITDLEGLGSDGANGGVKISIDNGETWQDPVNQPRPPIGWDPNELIYAANIERPGFLAVGARWMLPWRAGTAGGVYYSEDGFVWEEVYLNENEDFFMAAALTPASLPRTLEWRLVVDRYSQLQEWEDNPETIVVGTENNNRLVVQTDRTERYRGSKLVNADRDWQVDALDDDNIPHTARALDTALDPICAAGHMLPRTKSWRIPGGYLVLHGSLGRASRSYCYPAELAANAPSLSHEVGADVAYSAFEGAADLEIVL